MERQIEESIQLTFILTTRELIEGGLKMKRTVMMGTSLVVLVLIGAVTVFGGQMPMGGQGGQQEQPPGTSSMPGRGMMGMPMMGMMCPVMGGPTDPMGMMGVMSGGQMDPKAMGRMLELRGELLKAAGEVMVKHGQAMSREQ
jgi:hypothetical protein